jgi:hypothetical protein
MEINSTKVPLVKTTLVMSHQEGLTKGSQAIQCWGLTMTVFAAFIFLRTLILRKSFGTMMFHHVNGRE